MPEIDLDKIKKAYFIGIGGIGMSAVARMFLLEGKSVAGSDLAASDVTSELARLGAEIRIGRPGQAAQTGEAVIGALPAGVELVVYTPAIPENHPELVDARAKKIPAISYPETLGIISKNKFTIAIAGTHGKTTTTGMVAQILIETGLDPTVIVGSLLRGVGAGGQSASENSNFIGGKSKYFVVEACEYKRSFLNLRPDIAVITNIDADHLDYYKDFAGVQAGFRDFLGLVKNGGTIITDLFNDKIRPVLFGLNSTWGQDIAAVDYDSIEDNADPANKIHLKIPGRHNIQNAKAALAVALALGIPREKALAALANFSGTWRRFEEKGQTAAGALVYDDYAHHPSEIAATLQAAREKFPSVASGPASGSAHRLVVAFQPHLFSRTKEHLEEFAAAFALADEVLLLPIYAAREPADPTISSEILAAKIRASAAENNVRGANSRGQNVLALKDFAAAAEYLKENLKAGDVLFTMGAGDITKLATLVL